MNSSLAAAQDLDFAPKEGVGYDYVKETFFVSHIPWRLRVCQCNAPCE